jgi:3-oxoacyl-(acyl-carrier-protein) synthase
VARLAALVGRLAGQLPEIPAAAGLVVSTTKGAPDELLADTAGPWPGQPWDLGRLIGAEFDVTGPVSTVSAACASGTLAVIAAAQQLRAGLGPAAFLVVGIDLLSVFVTSGFARLQALTKTECRPFDRNRDGLALGEGAGALLLTTRTAARRRDWPVLAVLGGWGVSGDAGHITAPCREAGGLLRALARCTANGRRRVGAINAHGTGTRFNDAMEIRAFQERFAPQVPFHSVKGAIGHCLGAAGVIELAVAINSLAEGRIPPTVGLAEPDEKLGNLAGNRPFDLVHPSVLSCNSGFGGINAAVLLTGPAPGWSRSQDQSRPKQDAPPGEVQPLAETGP